MFDVEHQASQTSPNTSRKPQRVELSEDEKRSLARLAHLLVRATLLSDDPTIKTVDSWIPRIKAGDPTAVNMAQQFLDFNSRSPADHTPREVGTVYDQTVGMQHNDPTQIVAEAPNWDAANNHKP